jgi:Uma2 family endonuclease
VSSAGIITTASQLSHLPDDGQRYELIMGELRMMSPAGGTHGMVALRIGRFLGAYVDQQRLGAVFAAETGFLLATNPDTVRAPDVAYVSQDRLASLDNLDGFLRLAPDLAIEVVSPRDTSSEVESKAEMWLTHGTRMVLVVDPSNQSIRKYCSTSAIEVAHVGDQLDCNDVVPGWKLNVADVFSQ